MYNIGFTSSNPVQIFKQGMLQNLTVRLVQDLETMKSFGE